MNESDNEGPVDVEDYDEYDSNTGAGADAGADAKADANDEDDSGADAEADDVEADQKKHVRKPGEAYTKFDFNFIDEEWLKTNASSSSEESYERSDQLITSSSSGSENVGIVVISRLLTMLFIQSK